MKRTAVAVFVAGLVIGAFARWATSPINPASRDYPNNAWITLMHTNSRTSRMMTPKQLFAIADGLQSQ